MLASSALDEQNRFLLLVNDADYAELRTAEQMLYKNVDAYILNSPEHGYSSYRLFDSTLDLYIKTWHKVKKVDPAARSPAMG